MMCITKKLVECVEVLYYFEGWRVEKEDILYRKRCEGTERERGVCVCVYSLVKLVE